MFSFFSPLMAKKRCKLSVSSLRGKEDEEKKENVLRRRGEKDKVMPSCFGEPAAQLARHE